MKVSTVLVIVFFLFALIAGIGATSYYYTQSVDVIEEEVYDHLKTAVHSRAHHVETFLEEQKEKILMAADMDFPEESMKKEALKFSGQELDNVVEELEEILEINDDFEDILILNLPGDIVASTNPEHIGKRNFEDVEFLINRTGAHITEIHYSDILKKLVIEFSANMIDDDTKEIVGVVVAVMALDELAEITTREDGLGETGEVYLIDKEGRMITPSRFLENEILVQKVDTINSRNCLEGVSRHLGLHEEEQEHAHEEEEHEEEEHEEEEHIGHEAVEVFLDYRGEKVLGTHLYIPEVNWCLLAEMDEAEILGKQRELFQKVALTIIIVLTVFAILSGFIIGRQIDKVVVFKKFEKKL